MLEWRSCRVYWRRAPAAASILGPNEGIAMLLERVVGPGNRPAPPANVPVPSGLPEAREAHGR